MLTKIRPGVVGSTEGFEVADLGIFNLVYREGDREVRFPKDAWEDMFYLQKVEWEPPHRSEIMSEERKREIQDRVIAALAFLGHPFRTDLSVESKLTHGLHSEKTAASGKGVTIWLEKPDVVVYQQGERVMKFRASNEDGEFRCYIESFGWEYPHAKDVVGPLEREEIKNRLVQALAASVRIGKGVTTDFSRSGPQDRSGT